MAESRVGLMDIQRPASVKAQKTRRMIITVVVVVLMLGGVTYGLTRLRPAAPTVDDATIWKDTVRRGPMILDVRGLGTLVPEDIRWIPAQSQARVDRIVLRSGDTVKPTSVVLELSDPQLQRDALDAEYQLKAAEADYANLKVQVNSELASQKANEASVRSDYEQAKRQAQVDEQLFKQGLTAEVTAKLSKVRAEQLAIRIKFEEERTRIASDSAQARLDAQRARVDQQKALYNPRKTELRAAHSRGRLHRVVGAGGGGGRAKETAGTNLARFSPQIFVNAQIQIAETQ